MKEIQRIMPENDGDGEVRQRDTLLDKSPVALSLFVVKYPFKVKCDVVILYKQWTMCSKVMDLDTTFHLL